MRQRCNGTTQTADLLQVGLQSNWYPEFAASQPIAGLDGTLRDTAAVAGYVRDVQGKDWVVVGFINDDNSKQGRPALDALIEWVDGEMMAGIGRRFGEML